MKRKDFEWIVEIADARPAHSMSEDMNHSLVMRKLGPDEPTGQYIDPVLLADALRKECREVGEWSWVQLRRMWKLFNHKRIKLSSKDRAVHWPTFWATDAIG